MIPKQTGPIPTTPENINIGIIKILVEFKSQIFIKALFFAKSYFYGESVYFQLYYMCQTWIFCIISIYLQITICMTHITVIMMAPTGQSVKFAIPVISWINTNGGPWFSAESIIKSSIICFQIWAIIITLRLHLSSRNFARIMTYLMCMNRH